MIIIINRSIIFQFEIFLGDVSNCNIHLIEYTVEYIHNGQFPLHQIIFIRRIIYLSDKPYKLLKEERIKLMESFEMFKLIFFFVKKYIVGKIFFEQNHTKI